MTYHLLDTDGVIDVLKGVRTTIAFLQHLVSQGATLCINDVVLAEVYAGLHPQDETAAEQFLTPLEYVPASVQAAQQAGRWRYLFARRGRQLSLTDCLIAATAVEHQAILVTGNTRDFPMPGVQTLALPQSNR